MAKNNGQRMDGEVYYPSEEVIAQANLQDWEGTAARAAQDPQGFWAAEAEELPAGKPGGGRGRAAGHAPGEGAEGAEAWRGRRFVFHGRSSPHGA